MSTSTLRLARLIAIGVGVATLAITLWVAGRAVGSSIVEFCGLMVGATTFVPLPADTFVLAVSDDNPAIVIGVVGGLINAAMVLVERFWILTLVDHPSFGRFKNFFAANRFVGWTEKNMFLALIVGAASFLPFEPFRLVAVMTNYSLPKYFLATFLARGSRYYVLAAIGTALLDVGFLSQAIWISLGLFFIGLLRSGYGLFVGTSTQPDTGLESGQDSDLSSDAESERQDGGRDR